MTSNIRDVTKAGVQAETTLVDLIGNAINENSQTAALTLEKIFDRLSKITDHNNDAGNSFADRLSTALDKLRSAHDSDKGWNGSSSSDKSETTSTKGDLDSTTDLASTKPGSVTDTVSAPTVSDTQDETALITPAKPVADAPAAAAAAAAASTVTGFPDASNTGIAAGSTMTKFTGTYRVTQDNAVISNLEVYGAIIIDAK
ncbi:cytoskeletal protein RodZ, partial [Mycoplana sp. BE70]|nr:cytoskeletal protein RodZ [Mycoplana sp. BE70]